MKKPIALFLCVIIALTCLVSCSREEEDGQTAAESLVVGVIASDENESFLNGVKKASDQIDYLTSGKEDEVKIEVKVAFDGGDPAKAKTAYADLKAAGAKVIIGPTNEMCCLAVIDAIETDGLLQIIPTASGAARVKAKNSFRLCTSNSVQGERMAEYLLETAGYKSVAVIASSEGRSADIAAAFTTKFTALAGDIPLTLTPDSVKSDPVKAAGEIEKSGAKAIFMPTDAKTAAECARALYKEGVTLPFAGGEEWDTVTANIPVDEKACVKGALYIAPFIESDGGALNSSFCEAYRKEYGTDPDREAAYGYDALCIVRTLLDRIGTVTEESITARRLVTVMSTVNFSGVTGDLTFDFGGNPVRTIRIAKIAG